MGSITVRSDACLRYSTGTGWSLFAGGVVAVLQFVGSLVLLFYWPPDTIAAVPMLLLGPFVTFICVATIAHRRSFIFNGASGTLTIDSKIFLMRIGDAVSIPLSKIVHLEFADRSTTEGEAGSARITIDDGRQFDIPCSKWGITPTSTFRELHALLAKHNARLSPQGPSSRPLS